MQQDADWNLPAAADYPIYTIGTNVAGVFTASGATTKATLFITQPVKAGEKVTCKGIASGSVIRMQNSTAIAPHAAIYQAADGKISDSAAGSALAMGQNGDIPVSHASGSPTWGRFLVTR